MASRNSKKSSSLRLLWIPGGRKNHPKGRFSSTNKQVFYTARQKKSEVWSLGGSKTQQNLLQADSNTTLLDGPSTSGLSSLASASGAAAATAAVSSTKCSESHTSIEAINGNSILNNKINHQQENSPTTPNSSTSTAPLISPPQSPLEQQNNNSTQPSITSNTITTATTMPAKYHQRVPVIVTETTTDNIMEVNRFSLLADKDTLTNESDINSLPSPPTYNLNSQENLNNSSGTTISQLTPSGSPHKTNSESQKGSVNNSPIKKKQRHRNHNNNQGDVNSIESVTEDSISDKIPSGDLDWVDTMVKDREILAKPKKKKHTKELDQLDGVPTKETSENVSIKEEDEKVVKCLYYTLMCCDCTIS